ncbi:thiamine diphosphokinase [Halocynthiibacter sp. C4]|uniref:thiamine diphosphokinase n=1 Tax=Halocynthiibacter sp. C4 TaxID=2992758 RepID=UPI00237B3FE7|nr:thiamine diphosphokinase [Halocynthiibacter sp. C4]MDE0590143.1 thiamine diphosphokinase [Halocynthiibacter sp. C4]
MDRAIVSKTKAITLVGGGDADSAMLEEAQKFAPTLVACDGGAGFVLKNKGNPEAVIGDMDSIDARTKAAIAPDRLHFVAEQDTTDFEKALLRIEAPLILGVGFLGGRLDHELAVLHALVKYDSPKVILLGREDIAFVAPERIALDLPIGSRLSLFPLGPVSGVSEGLEWPIKGLSFDPLSKIGTSNRVTGPVELSFSNRAMLLILPRAGLSAVIDALGAG